MSNQVKTKSKKKDKAKAQCAPKKNSQPIPEAQKEKAVEVRANVAKSELQGPAKTDLDQEKHVQTIEIRDKRINIVFKTIYVFAIFFAAVFLDLSRQLSAGLTSVFAAEACLAAFLLAVIVSFSRTKSRPFATVFVKKAKNTKRRLCSFPKKLAGGSLKASSE